MTRDEAFRKIVDNNFCGQHGFDLQILVNCIGIAREFMLGIKCDMEMGSKKGGDAE